MPYVCTSPFDDHAKGDHLSDEDGQAAVAAGHESFVVCIAAPPEPEPQEHAPAV